MKTGFCTLFVLAVCCELLLCNPASAARPVQIVNLIDKPDAWFTAGEGNRIVNNILSWQNANGGWWKNYDPTQPRPAVVPDTPGDAPPGDDSPVWHKVSTFDNDATHSELRILARAQRVTGRQDCRDGFNRGLTYVFSAQYPTGGFPQRFPLQDNYGRYITLNDNAMIGVMTVLRDVALGRPDFTFVSAEDRARSRQAFDRALDCIVKCQIRVRGELTVWCQQHDPVTLEPRGGRAYELPSLASSESADVVELLMEQRNPDDRLRKSIDGAVAWFRSSQINGKRLETIGNDPDRQKNERRLIDDPAAPPMWARFYDIDTNKPFFVSRDGIKRDSIDLISHERRMGYGWYNGRGTELFNAYDKWKKRADVTQN